MSRIKEWLGSDSSFEDADNLTLGLCGMSRPIRAALIHEKNTIHGANLRGCAVSIAPSAMTAHLHMSTKCNCKADVTGLFFGDLCRKKRLDDSRHRK